MNARMFPRPKAERHIPFPITRNLGPTKIPGLTLQVDMKVANREETKVGRSFVLHCSSEHDKRLCSLPILKIFLEYIWAHWLIKS